MAFLDVDENIQKITKTKTKKQNKKQKTITIFDPFSIAKFEWFDQFW